MSVVPKSRPHRCKQCERDDGEAGRISRSGLCAECAQQNIDMNNAMIRTQSGPGYNLWRKRWAEGMAIHETQMIARYGENPFTKPKAHD